MSSLTINKEKVSPIHQLETVLNVSGNTIEIYDFIVPFKVDEDDPAITVQDVTNTLDEASGDITIRINSRGGEVGTALAIYNRLKAYDKGKVTAIVEGHAFSSAGWIPMAADNREIATGGIFMAHNPSFLAEIDSLDSIESAKNKFTANHTSIVNIFEEATGLSSEEITEIMAKETFLSAEDAVNKGFFHKVHDSQAAKLAVLNYAPPSSLPEALFKGSKPLDTVNSEPLRKLRKALEEKEGTVLT